MFSPAKVQSKFRRGDALALQTHERACRGMPGKVVQSAALLSRDMSSAGSGDMSETRTGPEIAQTSLSFVCEKIGTRTRLLQAFLSQHLVTPHLHLGSLFILACCHAYNYLGIPCSTLLPFPDRHDTPLSPPLLQDTTMASARLRVAIW